jgi:cardiolipin synthase A/B
MDPVCEEGRRSLVAAVRASGSTARGRSRSTRQPALSFATYPVAAVQAAVSPDCAYRLVKSALDAARREICIYIYNASADHLLALVRDARDRGVRIRFMVDVADTRGNERQKLAALGVELKEAPSTGGRRVFTVCHCKFVVVDSAILLIGSANWATTSIPLVVAPGSFKKGNREWLARVDDYALAGWFRTLFEADWDIPSETKASGVLETSEVLEALAEDLPGLSEPLSGLELLAHLPDQVFDLAASGDGDRPDPIAVTPILSPDNYYDQVRALLLQATSTIDIEQQYILAGGPKTVGLLRALKRRRDAGVTVRVIVSPAYRKIGASDTWELSVAALDAFGLQDCLRAMNLGPFTHLHNKGIVVDRQRVLVSSTNWSENSVTRAREAGVLIESPAIAGYFARVFDFDWSIGWDPADVPANLQSIELAEGLEALPGWFDEIHPADLA